MAEAKKNLIFARVGASSLHREWLRSKRERNWDIAYGTWVPGLDLGDGEVARFDPGMKWDSIARFLDDASGSIGRYDYVWFPDDDLSIDGDAISAMFDTMRRFDLLIAQPSLVLNDNVSHRILVHNPLFTLRFVDFVEVMCPCFRVDYLLSLRDFLAKSPSGWGLDMYWAALMERPMYKAAVIDAVEVVHTRPIGGGVLYSALAAVGSSADEQRAAIVEGFVTPPSRHLVYGGVSAEGVVLRNTFLVIFRYAFGWARGRRGNAVWRTRLRLFKRHLGLWLTGRLKVERHVARPSSGR